MYYMNTKEERHVRREAKNSISILYLRLVGIVLEIMVDCEYSFQN